MQASTGKSQTMAITARGEAYHTRERLEKEGMGQRRGQDDRGASSNFSAPCSPRFQPSSADAGADVSVNNTLSSLFSAQLMLASNVFHGSDRNVFHCSSSSERISKKVWDNTLLKFLDMFRGVTASKRAPALAIPTRILPSARRPLQPKRGRVLAWM